MPNFLKDRKQKITGIKKTEIGTGNAFIFLQIKDVSEESFASKKCVVLYRATVNG